MKRFINILLYVVCIFLLISCEIGLGAAVDTEAPTVAITSPQAGSVIRDSFAVKGSWSDDGAISSIKVTLESTSNLIEPIVYDATVNLDEGSLVSGTWYCEINPESEGIIDGEYKASVVISDFGGHTTTIPSYLLTVDNTAPLIVLQRPATKVNETADAYGQTFTLEGIGADDNSINKIDLNIYTDAECTNLVKTVSKSNVPASINLELATFEENTQNEYSDIYGSTTSNGTIVRYFKLIAYDSAKTYPLEGEGSELGNSTSTYYLYDDIYESVLGSYNATTIYQMLNGTYLATDASRTAASVSSVVKSLSENELNISKFSLNPRNNPKFSVSGRESLGDSEINLDASSYELTNGSEVVIEVSTGLDGISLNGSSLRPYVLPCGVNASLSVADTAENRIYLAEAGSGSKSGTSYKFVVTLDNAATAANTDVKLDVDSVTPYYLFGVEGQDVKGNAVVANGNGYAIKFVSNGAAPDLSALQTSTDGSTWSSDSVVYIGKGKDLYIKGTVTVETGLASLAVFKDKTSNPTAICQDGSTTDPHTMYTSAVEGGQSSFEYKIDKSNFDQNVTKQYAIRLEATKNKTSSSTVTVRYDVEGPTIKNFMASPYTSDSTSDTRGLLNGTVTFSGLLSDAYSGLSSSNASWKVQKKDSLSDASWKDVAGLTGTISDPSEFSFTVDTTSVESSDTSVKYMRLVITAYDEAGNKSEIPYDYTVDQSTDRPTVLDDGTTLNTSLSYADLRANIATTVNKITKASTVTFKLSDDDGFMDSTDNSSGIVIKSTKNSTDGTADFTPDSNTVRTEYISIAGNPTGPTITYDLPDVEGSYKIELILTDKYGTLQTATNTYTFYVQLTGNAPTVSMSTTPSYVTTNAVSGLDKTYAKTEYTTTLTITEGSAPFTATRTNPDSSVVPLTVPSGTPPVQITDTFTPPTSTDGTVTYIITDTYGKSKTLHFDYKLDNQLPNITISKVTETSLGTNNASHTFTGNVDDLYNGVTLSGVAKVEVDFDTDHSNVDQASGNSTWNYIARFSELNLTEGSNTFYARAVDNVGNRSKWSSCDFMYDVSNPEASITKYTDVNSIDHILSSTSFDYGYKFSLSGRAYDSNALATVKLVQTKVGGPDGSEQVTTITTGLSVSNNEWTFGDLPRASEGTNFAADPSTSGETKAESGTYEYYVVVKDAAGKERRSDKYTVTVDNTPPTLTLDSPSKNLSGEDSLSGNSYTFKATSTDASGGTGSQYIYYKFDSDSEYTQASIDDGVQWKLTKTLGTGTSGSEYDFYEGQHTISVYSVDKAGNESEKITRTFYVDQAAPVVSASASHPVNASTNPNSEKTVTISGSVTESHGIKSFTINGEDCKSLIQNGGSWTYTNNPTSDGTYTYEIIATDNAERNCSLSKTVIVDTGFPSIPSITVKNTTIKPDSDNSSVWFGSKILSVVVTVTDNPDGSGIASVEYVVLDSDSEANSTSLADSEWTAMSLDTGANYKSSVIFDSDGENQKLYIRAIDGAGNVKYFNTDSTDASLDEYARHVPVQINIDTSTPDLSANYYQVGSGNVKAVSGSVYTNGSSPITVYGNYSDGVSGIQALTFKLGETTISPTVTYSTSEITSVYDITGRAADAAQGIDAVTAISFNFNDNESGESGITTENNKTIRSWKAVFTPRADLFGDESSRENKSLKLSVSGSNNASLPSSISPFNIVYDSTKPELSNLALATSSTSYSVYQPSSTEFSYYVNNTDGTFTISGNSSDSSGIDTVKVQLFKASNTSTTADLSNTFSDTAAYVWSYSGINIADWTDTSDTSDTRAVITATDNAGNSTSKEMTLKFDTSAPTVSHGLDAKNKDLYLRVGSNDNDDIDSSSTNPQWSKALDTDVGGKYSSATYGNALTMQIRGYFEDENGGSGASKVYYYVTQNEPTQTGNDLKSLVLASPTGTITKLSTEQEKRVFYNVTADATDNYGGTLFSEGTDYDKYYKKIPSNFSESLSGFATGKNYLVFVVTDNVGNSRLDTCSDGTQSYNYFTINIDQIGPVITTNTTDIMYSNGGSGIISLSGTVTDADAGVKSLSISVTTSQVNTYTATIGNSNTWTASVPNSIFASLSGNYTLTATAVDKAGTGNTSTLPVATILVDTTAPTLTLNSPTDADTSTNTTEINGRISLGGSASDANGLSTSDNLTLYYTWSESIKNKTDANLVPSDFGTDAKSKWVKISSISAVNNWTFNNINTASLEKEYKENETPKTTLYLMASAKDKAGNTGYSNRVTAIVDQDSDRPIIKFTNLELSTKMASSTPLPFASNSLYGSVTDDDGIISIKYKIGEDGEFTTVSGSNGSFNISLSDGSKNLSFEVTDCESVVLSEKPDDWNTEASTLYYTNKECTTAASTTFQSGTYYLKKTFTSSSNDSYNQAAPKLTDSNGNKYAYRDSTSGKKISVTYLKVDTKKPDVLSLEYTKTSTDESSWSTTASTYGGKNANNFYIRQFAYDANGIADSKVETNSEGKTTIAKDTYGTRLKVEVKANDKDVTGYTAADENYYYYALKAESSTREQNGKTYTEWRSSVVNTDGMESGNRNVIFEVFDGTSSTETEAIIVIDNTCPVISVSAPDSSQNSKGNVTAYGETDLTDWKKTSTSTDYTEHMYYALSFDGSTIPATDNSESALANVTAITSWKDDHNNDGSSTINYKPYYSEIIGGSFSWYIYFDGQTTTANHDVTFKQFLIDSGVTTQALIESTNSDEKFTTVVKAYLWIKAVDEVGNSTDVQHEILIDPQGDAPTVTFAYPESSGTTLGGEISLRGIATDDYGNTIGVDSVWVQIISAIENGYDSSKVTSTGTQTCGGLSFVDTVTSSGSGDSTKYSHAYTLSSFAPTMHDVHQWIEKGYKVYTNITSDTPTPVTSASASDESGANYYIKATLSGSAWSLAINAGGEFNPDEGKLNPIAYRIFAKDKDNNLSRYQQQLSVYDSDRPVISGLYLRQYADNENGKGAVTASRAYQDDMWVKGTWWLYGTVEDTQGLSSLKVGPATSKVNQTITGNAAAKETFNYLLSTGSGVGSLALVIEASDKASPVHSITKNLVINYDNTPPELVTSGSDFNISSTVQNSNGFYSFGSQVTENVVDSYSQSGFAYLAFWFERNITGKHVVYDVMRTKAKSEINYDDLTSDSGLMWKSVSVGRSSSSLGTLTLSTLDPNIHVGGLCKIAGSIYLISSVSADGLTIGIDGQPEYTAATETALFAIANVVNNNVESGSGTKSTTDGLYGYYSSISNDDGDHMVESVSKSGTRWNWEANINSQNMADGSVTLHYAAFDNAGNYVEGSVSGNVANNAPRIASLEVWSDFNENGSKDSGEYETKYYQGKERKIGGVYTTRASKVTDELVVSGNDNDYDASGSAFMTVKATTRFTPELIGGNGALYYSYKYGTSSTLASATTNIGSATIGNGTDNGIDETIDNEGYYIQDQNGLGYINGSTTAYMEIPGPGTGYTLSALGNSTSSTDPTWFEYTIYDSTEGSGTWSTTSLDSTNRLSAKFRVALNVQYNDTKRPVVKIRPFYWNSKTENSVCWDSYDDAEGHIELEADITNEIAALKAGNTELGSDDPKVSGKIKIEGYAFDDIKLNSLYGIVSNHTNLSTTTGTLLSTYNGAWASTPYSADTGWGFEAEDVYCNGDGHLVKWTLTIDTAKRTKAAQLDQTVVVYAKDDRSDAESAHSVPTQTSLTSYVWNNVKDEDNALTTYYTDFYCNTPVNSSTSATAIVYKADDLENMTSYYKMDIVPYISKVYTRLAKNKNSNWSVYNRTALGHYPVQSVVSNIESSITLKTSTSEDVVIYGFNLNDSSATFTSGSNTFTVGNETDTLLSITNNTAGQLSFNVAKLQTGELILKVNGISILNNINDDDAAGDASESGDAYKNWYNRQANGDTNNILTDDVYFDVWEFNDRAATPINGLATGINMEINQKTGMLNYAFANGGLYYSMGGNSNKTTAYSDNSYSSIYWAGDWDTFAGPCVGFHVDELGYTYSVVTGGDTNNSGHVDKYAFYTSRWGLGEKGTGGTYGSTNVLKLEHIALKTGDSTYDYSLMKYRFLSSEFASTINDNNTNLYMVYYDALTNQIRFRAGTFSGTDKETVGGFQDEASSQTPSWYSTTNCQIIANGESETFKTSATETVTISKITGRGAGQYVDIAVVKNRDNKDVVCVVWYDAISNRCKYSYITDPITNWDKLKGNTTAFEWSPPQPIFTEGGEYCHIVADKNNHLHIAAYAGNGDVMYAYLDTYKSTPSTCVVDASGSVGEHLTLDVAVNSKKHSIPYIGYYTGAIKKPKYAYLVDPTIKDSTDEFNPVAAGADDYERYTGAWEVAVVPTPSIMTTNREDKVNIGVWKKSGDLTDSKVNGVIENSSHSAIGSSGYSATNWSKTFGNGTSNGILGYQITTSSGSCLETAQMR
ncbi:MAG: Ig-like domain-containing protein [Treponema sp.]|nr:Ig-like domain-containing protein [Treponema sp.]